MRIHRDAALRSTTTDQQPAAAAPAKTKTSAKASDGFASFAKTPVALAMPPPPPAVAPSDSTWYRAKKEVILTFTGVNYDPHAAKLGPDAAKKMLEVLKPGDVILRRTDSTTSNWFIPGYWGHAALYAGDGKIVDAVTHDVREVGLEKFCTEGDAVIVVRPKGLEPRQVAEAIAYARQQIGKPYDFDLDFEDESRFSCTELVETALAKATGKGWGERNLADGIAPKDFLNDRFKFVWSNLADPPK